MVILICLNVKIEGLDEARYCTCSLFTYNNKFCTTTTRGSLQSVD